MRRSLGFAVVQQPARSCWFQTPQPQRTFVGNDRRANRYNPRDEGATPRQAKGNGTAGLQMEPLGDGSGLTSGGNARTPAQTDVRELSGRKCPQQRPIWRRIADMRFAEDGGRTKAQT